MSIDTFGAVKDSSMLYSEGEATLECCLGSLSSAIFTICSPPHVSPESGQILVDLRSADRSV